MIIVNGWKPLTIITKRSVLDGAAVLDPPLHAFIHSVIEILLCQVGCTNVRKAKSETLNILKKKVQINKKDAKTLQVSKYLFKASKKDTRTLFMYVVVIYF